MNIDLEQLSEIPKILELLITMKKNLEQGTLEKRWLNSNEVAVYTGYKLETIKAKVKSHDFIRDIHYYKRDGKLLFDRVEVDNWVKGNKPLNNSTYQHIEDSVIDNILASIAS